MRRMRRTRARLPALLSVSAICVGVLVGLLTTLQESDGTRTRAGIDRSTRLAAARPEAGAPRRDGAEDAPGHSGRAEGRDPGTSTGALARILELRRDPDPARASDLKDLRRDLPDTPEAFGAYALAAAGMAERADDDDLKHDLLLTALDAQLETLTRHRGDLASWDWENARAVFEKLAAAVPEYATQPGCATRMIPIRDAVEEELQAAANGAHTPAEAAEVALLAVFLGLAG